MKWIAISGSWRCVNKEIENEVRKNVKEMINRGDGIVTGGALNVDYIAIDQGLTLNPKADKIKVFLPVSLELYAQHYRRRAREGVITLEQAERLIDQLSKLRAINKLALRENINNKVVNQATYFERNTEVIKAADELLAFQVNHSAGVEDTIKKAKSKGIPIKLFSYTIKEVKK